MTPDEFAAEMRKIIETNKGDIEAQHADADTLICMVLIELGYVEGTEIFNEMDKWYA